MNGDRYKELIEQAKKATTQKDKQDFLATMVYMIATNDLEHLYKTMKTIRWMLAGVFLAILFSDQLSMTALVGFLIKLF